MLPCTIVHESKYGTNKPSWVSPPQIYVIYPCNYDNRMTLTWLYWSPLRLGTSRSSDAYMRHWTAPSLFQVVAFCQAIAWPSADLLANGSEETGFCKLIFSIEYLISFQTMHFENTFCDITTTFWDLSVAKFPTKIPIYHIMWPRTARSWTSMLTHDLIHVVDHKACKYSIEFREHICCNKTKNKKQNNIICSYQIQICCVKIIADDELDTVVRKLTTSETLTIIATLRECLSLLD